MANAGAYRRVADGRRAKRGGSDDVRHGLAEELAGRADHQGDIERLTEQIERGYLHLGGAIGVGQLRGVLEERLGNGVARDERPSGIDDFPHDRPVCAEIGYPSTDLRRRSVCFRSRS